MSTGHSKNDEWDCPGWKSCPRCTELEKQLQYWRKKSFYQKARDARWDKMKATRGEISVNVGSKFTGVVVEKDEEPAKGTQLYALDISYLSLPALTPALAS